MLYQPQLLTNFISFEMNTFLFSQRGKSLRLPTYTYNQIMLVVILKTHVAMFSRKWEIWLLKQNVLKDMKFIIQPNKNFMRTILKRNRHRIKTILKLKIRRNKMKIRNFYSIVVALDRLVVRIEKEPPNYTSILQEMK